MKVILLFLIGIVTTASFSSCGGCEYVAVNKTIISDFESSLRAINAENEEVPGTSKLLFLDYSGSMHQGIMASFTFLDKVVTIMDRSDLSAYKVGAGVPKQVSAKGLTVDQGENSARNISNYGEKASHLGEVMEMIEKEQKEAVFITDFMLYKSGSKPSREPCRSGVGTGSVSFNNSSWATQSFESWLGLGNAIDVFAFPVPKGNKTSLIFYLVFTPRTVMNSGSNVVDRLIEAKPTKAVHHRFCKSDFDAKIDFSAKPASEKALGSRLNFVISHEDLDKNWLYYQLDRDRTVSTLESMNEGKRVLVEDMFFRPRIPYYGSFKTKLAVEDVTSHLAEKVEMNQSGIEAKEGLDTEEAGVLLDQHPFELNDSLGSDGNHRFQIKVASPRTLPSKSTIYRLTILVDSEGFAWPSEIEGQLAWAVDDSKCIWNTSLVNSLKEAMQRTQLKDELLLTIYIQISC